MPENEVKEIPIEATQPAVEPTVVKMTYSIYIAREVGFLFTLLYAVGYIIHPLLALLSYFAGKRVEWGVWENNKFKSLIRFV